MDVRVSPITESDVRAVGQFLGEYMHGGISADAWIEAMRTPWKGDPPNHGFMLVAGDSVVGAYLAFYSERTINGRREQFCNLGSWCVLPEYRFHSLRLAKALLNQPDYHFTDLSPGPGVAKLNERLGFKPLDSTLVIIPTLPWLVWPATATISSSRDTIEGALTGADLDFYRDHSDAQAVDHLVVHKGSETCYVMLRRATPGRIRKVPFVWILHVSNRKLFARVIRPLARYLLVHYGALAIRAELRVIKVRPHPSSVRRIPHVRRMYKSPYLDADQIDYLYSELVCLSW